MTEYTENAADKETKRACSKNFTDKVYDAYVSPKKGKIDSAIQTRSELLYDLLCISGNSFDRA